MSSGYSRTPLAKKLGLKTGCKACVINAPKDYFGWLIGLPEDVSWVSTRAKNVDFVHLFVEDAKTLQQTLPKLEARIKRNGTIWVSWYKKASKIPTDVDESLIRNLSLDLGLVDVKVCAINEQWSGLKVVIRKMNR